MLGIALSALASARMNPSSCCSIISMRLRRICSIQTSGKTIDTMQISHQYGRSTRRPSADMNTTNTICPMAITRPGVKMNIGRSFRSIIEV